MNPSRAPLPLRLVWPLLCSAVGVLVGIAVIGVGGGARRVSHTVEVALSLSQVGVPAWARSFRFSAVTLGHVIIGQSHEVLADLRDHERVHVRQYEVLGPFFFLAYPASSMLALWRGQCPYLGNRFEKQAFAETLKSRGNSYRLP
jgi:hypothetical protein